MLNNNKKVNVAYPILVGEQAPSVDLRFGPYDSVAEAVTRLGASGLDSLVGGIFFGVNQTDGTLKVYFFNKDNATATDVTEVGGGQITAGSIATDMIADGAITDDKLSAALKDAIDQAGTADGVTLTKNATSGEMSVKVGGIDTSYIADDAVTAAKIADDAVGADALADGAVGTDAIADGAVTTAKIADESITSSQIAAGAVTSDRLSANAVVEANIEDGAVTEDKLKNNSVTTTKLDDDAVTTAKVADGAITTDKLAGSSVTEAKINPGAVTTTKLADDAVTAAKIADDAVTADALAADSVGADAIIDGAVGTDALAASAVTTAKLAADAVTAAKIADDAVTADKIATGAVTADALADDAVDTAAIKDGAITADKLAAGVVSTASLSDGSITTGKIADDAITAAKLADDAVETDAIKDGAVTTAKIADANVTKAKLAADAKIGSLVFTEEAGDVKLEIKDAQTTATVLASDTIALATNALAGVVVVDSTITEAADGTVASTNPVQSGVMAAYIKNKLGDLTGAMIYKGTVSSTVALPTSDVSVGDTYVVSEAGTYGSTSCQVGDMIIAATVSGTTITWSFVHPTSRVENKAVTLSAGTAATIATIDGTNITLIPQTIDDALSTTSENAVQNKAIGAKLAAIVTKQTTATSGSAATYKIADDTTTLIELPIATASAYGEVKVDTALSTTSENPVQNKAIGTAIGTLTDLETSEQTDIVSAVNEVLDAIVAQYDSTATYAEGALVYYDGGVYKCTTAITTAEAWTAAHWTSQGSIAGVLQNFSSDIDVSSVFASTPALPTGKSKTDLQGKSLYALVSGNRYPVTLKYDSSAATALFYYVDFDGTSTNIVSSTL